MKSRSGRTGNGAARPLRNAERVRWSKVRTAQARIAAGYYERADVKEKVLDALLRELTRR